ncbi:MAG: hypothetical protein ACLT3D_04260 [Lawsonibacter sp.]
MSLTDTNGGKEDKQGGGSGEDKLRQAGHHPKAAHPRRPQEDQRPWQLLAALKEAEDYAEANGSEDPEGDPDAAPTPA